MPYPGRALNFDPVTLGRLVAWWSPRANVVGQSNGLVDSWADIVGGQVLLSVVGQTCVYRSQGINNRPALFTATSGGAGVLRCAGFAISQPNTTYLVMAETAGTCIMADANGSRQILGSPGLTNLPGMFAGASIAAATTYTGPNVYCGLFNGANSSQFINGAAIPAATGNVGANNLNDLKLGGGVGGGMGLCGDLLYFSGLHGPADRAAIMAWLGSLYNIPGCG